MTRAERLQRIAKLADTASLSAAQRLGGSRRQRDNTLEKLAQFERYRDEYERTLHSDGVRITAARARELRQFIAQVDDAIAALRSQASNAERQYSDDRDSWQAQSQRTRALQDVHARQQRSDVQKTALRAQREADDRPASMPKL